MPKKYKYTKSFTFDGKRHFVHGNTLEEVIEKKTNKLRDLENGRVIINRSMRVEHWIDIALDTYKTNVKDRTLRDTKYRIARHIIPEIGYMRICDVKPLHCQRILNNLEGNSKSLINKTRYDLKFIFDTAIDNQLLLFNPSEKIVVPNGTVTKRQAISKKERETLEFCAENDFHYNLFLLMLYCGCRPSEAIFAQGMDIVEKENIRMLHIRGTKTINADRYVPIPDCLYEKIKDTPPFLPISPNKAGNFHSEASYKRLINHLKRDMNIAMGCTIYRNRLIPPLPLRDSFVPYDLRHTYCTDLARSGVDIRMAQKLMGHASIDMTANIYTNLESSDIANIAHLIGASPIKSSKNSLTKFSK